MGKRNKDNWMAIKKTSLVIHLGMTLLLLGCSNSNEGSLKPDPLPAKFSAADFRDIHGYAEIVVKSFNFDGVGIVKYTSVTFTSGEDPASVYNGVILPEDQYQAFFSGAVATPMQESAPGIPVDLIAYGDLNHEDEASLFAMHRRMPEAIRILEADGFRATVEIKLGERISIETGEPIDGGDDGITARVEGLFRFTCEENFVSDPSFTTLEYCKKVGEDLSGLAFFDELKSGAGR